MAMAVVEAREGSQAPLGRRAGQGMAGQGRASRAGWAARRRWPRVPSGNSSETLVFHVLRLSSPVQQKICCFPSLWVSQSFNPCKSCCKTLYHTNGHRATCNRLLKAQCPHSGERRPVNIYSVQLHMAPSMLK